MIARNLLEILACPETLQPLSLAPAALVAELNARAADGSLCDRSGRPVRERLDALLVRQDRRCGYPVRDAIPELAFDHAIPLSSSGA